MKKLSGLLCTMILLAACTKDKNDSSGIEGTYKFKNISAQTESTVTGQYGDKVVTTSAYTTTNNAGTVTFGNGSITATGLTYTMNTDAKYYQYDGSNLLDSSSFPFSFTLPPSSSSGQYKLVGSDSIYFPQGGITVIADGSGSYQAGANGGKYSLNGNLLTITQNVMKDSSFQDSGESFVLHESGVASMVMEKQ